MKVVKRDEKAWKWLNEKDLGYSIWDKKYRNNNESFDDWLDRISNNYSPIRKLIEEKKFIFAGRILANRGISDRKLTYSNCYVISPPDDNIESIFECASKLARTYSYGGGCGIDLSKLRPKGATTHNAAKESTGPISFMDIYSQVTGTISQQGRRGALMISLDVNHPDIEEFIDCKTDLSKVNFANISVRINDKFMRAVENNEDYFLRWPCDLGSEWDIINHKEEYRDIEYNTLIHGTIDGTKDFYIKKVKAKDLFYKLAKNNWDYAEPGILNWDHISNYNLLNNTDFEYAGTNPCAEEPLPAGGSCLLGSINLAEFVIDPFTNKARIDFESLDNCVSEAITGLNQVLIEGLELHPLEEQRNSVRDWRQIGLGTLGLGDLLIKLGITYGSDKSIEVIDYLYHEIAKISVETSLDLAKAHGCYPKCEKEKLVESSFITALNLSTNTLNEIRRYGLYNSQVLTCAPTGSIGSMLNVSTGVEPYFAFKYTRRTQTLDGKESYYDVEADIITEYKNTTGNTEIPEYFIESGSISPLNRVKVQATLQKWIDASISSTCNLKHETTIEEVFNLYLEAWRQRCKGITVFRDGCARLGILTTSSTPVEVPNTQAPKRPKELSADFYIITAKGEQFVVLVGLYNDRPYEIFAFRPNVKMKVGNHKGKIIKKSKMHYKFESDFITIEDLQLNCDNIEEKAATLYTSMLLRHGVDIKYVIKTAKKVNNNITSFSSAMCRVLSKYIPEEITGEKCPECGGDIINEGGCKHCKDCGWSKCE